MGELAALFQRFDWFSLIDVAIVALIIFGLLYLVRGTQAAPLLRGVIILGVIFGILGSLVTLPAVSFLFGAALPALLIAIPVIFQPELRRALERVGRVVQIGGQRTRHATDTDHMIGIIAQACQRLADRKHGALIVLERATGLENYADTGLKIDSVITSELLQNIFFRNSPLHDGAVIIRENRVLAAACILPLTSNYMSDRRLGLRHRAAIGITEATDAIAIVVSEEHGTISIAHNGRIIRRLDAARLETILRAFYQLDRRPAPSRFRRVLGRRSEPQPVPPTSTDSTPPTPDGEWMRRVRGWLGHAGNVLLALILAVLVWVVAERQANPRSEQTPDPIPLTLQNLPAGMVTYEASADKVQVTVRAPDNVWNEINPDEVSAWIDLSGQESGTLDLPVNVSVPNRAARVSRSNRLSCA